MPYRDILDFLKTVQDHPDIARVDSIGALAIHRSIRQLLDEADRAIGFLPGHVEEQPARLVRSPQSTQFLDLRQGHFQSSEQGRSPHWSGFPYPAGSCGAE